MSSQLKASQPIQADNRGERRQITRLKLPLPVHVTGYQSDHHKWQEISRMLDVSQKGACFILHQAVKPGLILHLSFPMPWRLRQFAHSEPSYKIYSVVRSATSQSPGEFRAGVEFIGQRPPQMYLERPWIIFNPSDWRGPERRRAARRKFSEIVWVEYYKSPHELVGVEQGCTENVSRTGARICVQDPPPAFDLVKVFVLGKGFEAYADVTNQMIGDDGVARLCVNFKEKEWRI